MKGHTKHIITGSALVLAFVGATSYAQQQAVENVEPIQATDQTQLVVPVAAETASEPIQTPVEPVAEAETTNEPTAPVSEPVAPVEQPTVQAPVILRGMAESETTPAPVAPVEVE